ncbi:MAG: sulfite exporter TauE/SafE family protein [Neisseriaceae bacterium]|nr:sulfite exporter TauE/SafE family protein [Neisseriaceae bacterium]
MFELGLILAVGFGAGITTILFGFGGGFVVVPFVYYLLSQHAELGHEAMHVAVATSTAVMILTASYASYSNWRSGNLVKETITPLIYFIAIGAALGAMGSVALSDQAVRLLFIGYMVLTIADCLLRRGFLNKSTLTPLSRPTVMLGGPLIGIVATALGVGGSVMTVPLLRRHGHDMKHCVSAANPLSIPVAFIGAGAYALLGQGQIEAPFYVGYINVYILSLLFLAGFAGIVFAKNCLPQINDALHAKIYVALLLLVLIAICL